MATKKKQFVVQALKEAADIFEERNELYGDNYKRHGLVMQAMFPSGIYINGVHDYNRFALLNNMTSKLTRYAHQFEDGGHDDSLTDLSVYAQMLKELDYEK